MKILLFTPNNIEMLVGETIDVYVACSPKLITDANSIAIYNAYSTLFKISKTDIVNNIMHFTVTGENNGSGNLEISGGKNVKNLDIVVNY